MKKLLMMIMCSLSGCALFQKTSKTTSVATQSSGIQLEATELLLKTTGKETRVFTYWNDSGVYQFQHIKEQLDQAKLNRLNQAEQHQEKQIVTTKIKEPLNYRIWLVIILLMLPFGYLMFRKRS